MPTGPLSFGIFGPRRFQPREPKGLMGPEGFQP